jgi:hypothetical protein
LSLCEAAVRREPRRRFVVAAPAAQCRARRVRLRSSWRSTTLTISFMY